jgi:hypothetical protein
MNVKRCQPYDAKLRTYRTGLRYLLFHRELLSLPPDQNRISDLFVANSHPTTISVHSRKNSYVGDPAQAVFLCVDLLPIFISKNDLKVKPRGVPLRQVHNLK